jgi:hypothetical protein
LAPRREIVAVLPVPLFTKLMFLHVIPKTLFVPIVMGIVEAEFEDIVTWFWL